jgi:hypothetical protein
MSTGTADERPKRMTLSDVVERLLARSTSDRTSVSLTRNSKGDTQIEVVVRTSDEGDVTTADDAAAKARELYEQLARRYPLPSGMTHSHELGPLHEAESVNG